MSQFVSHVSTQARSNCIQALTVHAITQTCCKTFENNRGVSGGHKEVMDCRHVLVRRFLSWPQTVFLSLSSVLLDRVSNLSTWTSRFCFLIIQASQQLFFGEALLASANCTDVWISLGSSRRCSVLIEVCVRGGVSGPSLIFQNTDAPGWLVRSHVTIHSNGERCMQAVMNQEQMAAQAGVSLLVPANFSSVSDPSST